MSKLIFGSSLLSVGLSLCIFPKLAPLKYHSKVFKYLSFFLHVRNKTNDTLIVKKLDSKKRLQCSTSSFLNMLHVDATNE